MPYDEDRIVVLVRIDTNSPEREERHQALAADIEDRIRQVIADPKYADIEPRLGDY